MAAAHQQRLIGDIYDQNPFFQAVAKGVPPGQIKADIVALLSPYVHDTRLLEELALEHLAPEAVRFAQLHRDEWAVRAFESVRPIYEASAQNSEVDCFGVFSEWQPDVAKGTSGFWSLYHLRDRSTDLPPEDWLYDQFRTIGSFIEGAIQPLLRELLAHVRITRGRHGGGEPIRQLDFGRVVGELHDTTSNHSVFAPPPWNVRLSQWRNVAQHHSFQIEQGRVVVQYGKAPNIRRKTLSCDGIRLLSVRVSGLFNAISAARSFFVMNNHDRFFSAVPQIEVRPEIPIVHLATALSTQGFQLVDLCLTDDEVEAVIADQVGGDCLQRAVHVSQFIYTVWRHFPRGHVRIRYRAHDRRRFAFSASGDLCASIGNGKAPLEELARNHTFDIDSGG